MVIDIFQIRDLVPIVKSFEIGEGTDFYRLYSLCVLLDRCVSKKTLPVSEKVGDLTGSVCVCVRVCACVCVCV